jgi:phage tail-like protein
MEIEVQEYREGGLNTNRLKFATAAKQSNLVCKRGIVDRNLWDWFQDIARGAMKFRNGTVVVHDHAGAKDAIEYQVLQAFPVKWSGSDLGASQNALAVETVEFAHQGLTRIK